MDMSLQPGQEKTAKAAAEYIPVFAMAAEDFSLLEAAKAEAGENPDAWTPVYQRLRKIRNEKQVAANQKQTNQQPEGVMA
jgi:hypothetical protein